jgi:CheY-like chemotaxis protein
MSLVGNLEDLPLADILQIVSLSKRTGILTIETEEGKNVIVFKNGLIVSAACPSPKIKNLGQVLLERQIVTPQRLQELLDMQKARGNEPLGTIILESGIIDRENLQQIIRNQIKATIYHLMSMSEGNFSFDLSEVIPFDDIHYNPLETVLEQGMNPQQLLLDSARLSDEENRDEIEQNASMDSKTMVMEIPSVLEYDDVITYDDMITPLPGESAPKLEDLQLPETHELPDIAFDRIAAEIDFPMSAAEVAITPVIPTTATAQQVILVVDDEALIRQILARAMGEKGYKVLQADNAADAIRIVNQLEQGKQNPWVISDLVMPTTVGNGYLGGLEIVEAVRRINSSIPIIVMNDFEDPKAQTRAFALGVHQFHKKPNIHKASMNDMEEVLSQFSNALVEAFRQPPHRFRPLESAEDYWSDLGVESTFEEPGNISATNMMRQMAELHQIIQQLRNPNEAPEISLLMLRYAAEFFDRGLLFLVKQTEVNGLGGFGDTGDAESMPTKVRRIKIPLTEDSIFLRVVRKKQTHIGKLVDTPANRKFVEMTGRLMPLSMAMVPLISGNEVIALLYGDNAVTKKHIKGLEALEIFMVQAGIAMENALLHRKIETLKIR